MYEILASFFASLDKKPGAGSGVLVVQDKDKGIEECARVLFLFEGGYNATGWAISQEQRKAWF